VGNKSPTAGKNNIPPRGATNNKSPTSLGTNNMLQRWATKVLQQAKTTFPQGEQQTTKVLQQAKTTSPKGSNKQQKSYIGRHKQHAPKVGNKSPTAGKNNIPQGEQHNMAGYNADTKAKRAGIQRGDDNQFQPRWAIQQHAPKGSTTTRQGYNADTKQEREHYAETTANLQPRWASMAIETQRWVGHNTRDSRRKNPSNQGAAKGHARSIKASTP